MHFQRPIVVRHVEIMFQGGFVGKSVRILAVDDGVESYPSYSSSSPTSPTLATTPPPLTPPLAPPPATVLGHFYPADGNQMQRFDIVVEPESTAHSSHSQQLLIAFDESTDFYGRITVYHLGLYGELA